MLTIKKQYYGIKFPFTANNHRGFFIDLNDDNKERVISSILHVILTPKGSRLRKPDFGTNLIKFIFEPSDEITWEDVQEEVKTAVAKYVRNAELESVEIIQDKDDDNKIYLGLSYNVYMGKNKKNYKEVVEI